MSWYVHPSKQLRDDELPPELVVTNRDGSVEQVYVPYNSSDQLEAENAKLRELVSGLEHCVQGLACNCCPLYDPSGTNHRRCESLERELGIEVDG